MLEYFNNDYSYNELLKRCGDFSQFAGIKRYTFCSGRSKGVEAADIRTGSGLSYTVLLDRACDIAWAEYKGIPLCYVSQTGIVSPQYYEPENNEWLRSFQGGLLTTCGLTNVGAASETEGVHYGQHGRISNLPADHVCIDEQFNGNDHVMSIYGQINQVKAFQENVRLHRTIESYAGRNVIRVKDTVENRGPLRQPIMLLYHINFGFPLINEKSGLFIPNRNRKAGNAKKEYDAENYDRMKGPDGELEEETYYLDAIPDQDGYAHVCITNDKNDPRLAIKIRYSRGTLDRLVLWKHLNSHNYVLCVEPANCHVEGRKAEQEKNTLRYINPFCKEEYCLEIEVLDNPKAIKDFTDSLYSC